MKITAKAGEDIDNPLPAVYIDSERLVRSCVPVEKEDIYIGVDEGGESSSVASLIYVDKEGGL